MINSVSERASAANVIPLKRTSRRESKNKILKVAAYCRVSKDIEIQQTSLETQMATYNELISKHEDWELAEIYADQGISGTSLKNRDRFNQMIEDANSGKIDLILVKSVSRFARNTVDTLDITRKLREINVGVYFEKERINTLTISSELMLTMYAAFYQEESRDLAENQKAATRSRFKMGIPKYVKIYGYDNVERNKIEINPNEAKVVKRIFTMYMNGYSILEICSALNGDCIPSPNEERWSQATVASILTSEKMIGDALCQKTYTRDHLSHAKVINTGKVEQYYIKDAHEAIIDRETFKTVQNLMAMRRTVYGVGQYPYYGFLRCPKCGKPMVRINLKGKENRNAWICPGSGEEIFWNKRNACGDNCVRQTYIDRAIKKAIMEMKVDGLPTDIGYAIHEFRSRLKKDSTIHYIYLKKLMESITFPDWDHIEITWLNGEKTVLPLECDRGIDHPEPTVIKQDRLTYLVGSVTVPNAGIANVEKSIAATKAYLQGITIVYPGPDEIISIPSVKMEGMKRDENQKNSTRS